MYLGFPVFDPALCSSWSVQSKSLRNSRDVGPRFQSMSVQFVRQDNHGYRGSLSARGGRSTVAQARLSMRRIREILRLQAEGYSEREIARSLGCARSSVQICLWR